MQRRVIIQSLLGVGILVFPALAGAQAIDRDDVAATTPSNDVLPIPVVGYVTQHFLLSGNYAAHLKLTNLRIDHMADQTECTMPKRVCRLSIAYSQPIGNHVGLGEFELPLIGSEGITSPWSHAEVGDYIASFSDVPRDAIVPPPTLGLLATLKF